MALTLSGPLTRTNDNIQWAVIPRFLQAPTRIETIFVVEGKYLSAESAEYSDGGICKVRFGTL